MLRNFITSTLSGGNKTRKTIENIANIDCFNALAGTNSKYYLELTNIFQNQPQEFTVSKSVDSLEVDVFVKLNTYKKRYSIKKAIYNAYSPLKSSILGIHGDGGVQYNFGNPAIVKNGFFESGTITMQFKINLSSYMAFLSDLESFALTIQKFLPGTELKDGLAWKIDESRIEKVGPAKSNVVQSTTKKKTSFLLDEAEVDRRDLLLGPSGISFDEVILEDGVRGRITGFLSQIRNKELLEKRGLTVTHGIALFGEPGVGKTEIMRAFQSEKDLDVYGVKKADYDSMWKGVGEQKFQNYLNSISSHAKESGRHAIIMFDEADGIIGRKSDQNKHRADVDILNALLRFLDGLEKNSNVTVIISTNVPKNEVEPSILRSGRIDEIIEIQKPGILDRARIFLVHIQKHIGTADSQEVGFDTSILIYTAELAKVTEGFTGADIKKVIDTTIKNGLLEDRSEINAAVDESYKLLEKLQVKNLRSTSKFNPNIIGIESLLSVIEQMKKEI